MLPGGAVSVGCVAEASADYQAPKRPSIRLTPDFVSLEGYLSGRLVAAALEMAGPNPTRADMLRIINDVGRFDKSAEIS